MNILLAEDEKDLSRALTAVLQHNGYNVTAVYDGEAAVEEAKTSAFGCMIFDIMMPKMDGITALGIIRESGDMTPILLLTAKSEMDDKVAGLDAGADDYITKPFAIEELLARIRVALKKRGASVQDASAEAHVSKNITIGEVSLNEESHEVKVKGNRIELTNREFELLRVLMVNKNIVMNRDKLMNLVCGYDYMGETNVIDVYVRYIRTKIDDRFGIKFITTVRGVGYVVRDN